VYIVVYMLYCSIGNRKSCRAEHGRRAAMRSSVVAAILVLACILLLGCKAKDNNKDPVIPPLLVAPELSVSQWVQGGPYSLAGLSDYVVLLNFTQPST
jgi:hypothetical protein